MKINAPLPDGTKTGTREHFLSAPWFRSIEIDVTDMKLHFYLRVEDNKRDRIGEAPSVPVTDYLFPLVVDDHLYSLEIKLEDGEFRSRVYPTHVIYEGGNPTGLYIDREKSGSIPVRTFTSVGPTSN